MGAFCALALWVSSTALAGPILNPTQESLRWPYQKLEYTAQSVTSGTSNIEAQVQEAHRRYRDSVFFDGVYSVYNPSFFPSDRFIPKNIGDVWVQSSGEWSSVIITENVPDRPLGVFGTQIIYDYLNNTPDLWHYTKIDWGNWPFSIRITHVADVKIHSIFDNNFRNYADDSLGSNSIPAPGAVVLLGLGAAWASQRNRRR